MQETGDTIDPMPNESGKIELAKHELRAIAGYAAECAHRVLPLFERDAPADSRPRDAIDAALVFSRGGERTAALWTSSLAAFKAAREASSPAAVEAARAASLAAAAAYLHPLASAHQVKHILGAAAHAARAAEVEAGDDRRVGTESRDWALQHAPSSVAAVLARYPAAPAGGGRVGELLRDLDAALRPDSMTMH
jgi:hypothetical protein